MRKSQTQKRGRRFFAYSSQSYLRILMNEALIFQNLCVLFYQWDKKKNVNNFAWYFYFFNNIYLHYIVRKIYNILHSLHCMIKTFVIQIIFIFNPFLLPLNNELKVSACT